jgi:two-component system sensor histidine kinase KdpD
MEASRRNERRTEALYRLGRKLTGINGADFIAAEAERAVSEVLGGETAVFLPRDGSLRPILDHRARFAANASEIAVAQWVYDHGQIAGRGTDTLPSAQALYLPLASPNGTVGVLAVRHEEPAQLLLPEFRQVLENYATHVAMALERDRLTVESHIARMEAETEKLRNTLLSSVSHDLRTPLAVIAGASSSLLQENAILTRQTSHELLETIYEEAGHLSRLVENLLRLTQLSSGRFNLKKEWHPLEDVIGSALRRLERRLADRPVNVGLPGDMVLVQVDPVLIEQVLVNILENASRYTPAATPIEITGWLEGRKTILEIADHGPGLPPGEEQRIFEQFQRGSNIKADTRGAGLGLAICRAIMDAHGGRISARSRADGGAIFRLEFVAAAEPPALALASGPSDEAAHA